MNHPGPLGRKAPQGVSGGTSSKPSDSGRTFSQTRGEPIAAQALSGIVPRTLKPMRIALFTDTWAPQVNGVVHTLQRLAGHIRARGSSIALVAPASESGPGAPVDLHLPIPGISAPLYPELRLCRPINRLEAGRIAAFGPDIVHVATEGTIGWSGVRWARSRGVPLVTSYHTNFAQYLPDYGLGALEAPVRAYLRRFHASAAVSLCPSRATRLTLLEQGFHDRFRVWRRGVDCADFTPKRRSREMREALAPGAERIVLYVGRLAPEKRISLLLDAFPEIRRRSSRSTSLVLVGDGPAAADLHKRAPADVHFTGYLRGAALADAYAAADVFAFPSDTETFGNVVLEAMASGLPVVAPDRGGVTDSVRSGETGVQFAAGRAQSLGKAVVTLLEEEGLRRRLAAGARSHAESQQWPGILDGVLDVYADALHGPAALAA